MKDPKQKARRRADDGRTTGTKLMKDREGVNGGEGNGCEWRDTCVQTRLTDLGECTAMERKAKVASREPKEGVPFLLPGGMSGAICPILPADKKIQDAPPSLHRENTRTHTLHTYMRKPNTSRSRTPRGLSAQRSPRPLGHPE